MAAQQGIKHRIKSVTNTKQITKAMQLVAASKLRKAQESALQPRAYLEASGKLIGELAYSKEAQGSGLFVMRPPKKSLTIVISSDRGLAGAYNSNIIKAMVKHLKEGSSLHKIISVGRYA